MSIRRIRRDLQQYTPEQDNYDVESEGYFISRAPRSSIFTRNGDNYPTLNQRVSANEGFIGDLDSAIVENIDALENHEQRITMLETGMSQPVPSDPMMNPYDPGFDPGFGPGFDPYFDPCYLPPYAPPCGPYPPPFYNNCFPPTYYNVSYNGKGCCDSSSDCDDSSSDDCSCDSSNSTSSDSESSNDCENKCTIKSQPCPPVCEPNQNELIKGLIDIIKCYQCDSNKSCDNKRSDCGYSDEKWWKNDKKHAHSSHSSSDDCDDYSSSESTSDEGCGSNIHGKVGQCSRKIVIDPIIIDNETYMAQFSGCATSNN